MTSGNAPSPEDELYAVASGIVSPEAARLYVDVVFERVGQDVSASDAAARELIESRLVGVGHDNGDLFAYPPRAAIARASISRVRSWLTDVSVVERAMDSIERLDGVLRRDPVAVSPDVDATVERRRTLDSIIVSASQEICLAQDFIDHPDFMEGGWSAVAPSAVDRPNLPHRYVYDHRLFRAPWFADAVEQEVAAGIEVRVTHLAIPSFLLIVDKRIAAYSPVAGQAGRVSSEDGLVGLLTLAFEGLWSRGVPLDASAEMTSAQRSVLALLGLGYTNRMISHALGIHERTVRRRVVELLDHFGETQRAALVARSVRLED